MRADWSPEAIRRLGHQATQRRLELGYRSQDALAGEGEPHLGNSTIQMLEAGRAVPVRDATRERYERKLRWKPGTFLAILEDPDHVPETIKATAVALDADEVSYPAVVAATEMLSPAEQENLMLVLIERVHHHRRPRRDTA
jgi:hypothetical protein